MSGGVTTRQLVLFGIFFILLSVLTVTVVPDLLNTTTVGAKHSVLGDYTYTTTSILGTQVSIDAAGAVAAVKNDSVAAAFMDVKFTTSARRAQKVSLVSENGSLGSRYVWYVELVERSCYCGGDQDLYVVEAFVDPADGHVMNVFTKTVLESQYAKNTCAGQCH